MATKQIRFQDLPALVGQEVGVSGWYLVTQHAVDAYAAATDDHQWICEDVERAKRESPFGGTVAPGYFILALVPGLLKKVWYLQGARLGMNYGINRMRFPAPLLIGKRVRLRVSVHSVKPVQNEQDGQEVALTLSFEVEDGEKPVCVVETVYRYLGDIG
jgi:acyl dehydratase